MLCGIRSVRTVILFCLSQTLWGPGIPNEPAYSATGDEPGMGICIPGIQSILNHTAISPPAHNATSGKTSSTTITTVPDGCQAPPQLPSSHLSSCATQLLRLVDEDAVENVRICAALSLQMVSAALDKK